jgi:inhibitor of KinA sporulation pathway (predicted exonuclease)
MPATPTSPCYLAVDLEATCCNAGSVPRREMEIIEIGAVLVDGESFAARAEFQTFVRPVRHPILTPFCTALTGIAQADVDAAPHYRDAIARFRGWLYPAPPGLVFCSWGDYDREQLEQDCAYRGVPFPIAAPHVNVKRRFAEVQHLKKRPGLSEAVKRAGLAFAGRHHRGIDDARNIARLLPFVFGSSCLPERGTLAARRQSAGALCIG